MLIYKPSPCNGIGNHYLTFFCSFYNLRIKQNFYSPNSCNCFHLVQEKKTGENWIYEKGVTFKHLLSVAGICWRMKLQKDIDDTVLKIVLYLLTALGIYGVIKSSD